METNFWWWGEKKTWFQINPYVSLSIFIKYLKDLYIDKDMWVFNCFGLYWKKKSIKINGIQDQNSVD